MKTVIIADVHGRDLWKQIVAQESDADRFVFLGDYFDSFDVSGVEQLHNFKEIIEFKETSSAEVVLLLGNHDYHYLPEINDSSTSGYQPTMAPSFKQVIGDNRHHLQIAYQMDEFLFSHAGISSEWMDDNFVKWETNTIADQVNELFKYKPTSVNYRSFKYYKIDTPEENAILAAGYGDETFQGPLWIRPKSLMDVNYDTLRKQVIQVVGHTYKKEIDKKGAATGGRYYFVDVQETSEEYMIITDNNISFNTTKKQ
jgi:UDP-2,3-diacylglucosamine pyrophosphatase LpxH